MNVNLHHLELFYYVAKAKGISNALKIIPYGIQQPAVSQQLIRLEETLNVKLFERKPFSLTPAGEKLYRYLSRFFRDLDGELLSLRENSGARLRFGCPSIISSKYLPFLIHKILAKFPDIRPCIVERDGEKGIPELMERHIDVLITFSAPQKSKSMVITHIAKMPMCLVVPNGHNFIKGYWPKTDFESQKWIALQESTGGTKELYNGLSAYGISPIFSAETNSIEACLDYVEMGLGIALMAMPPPDLLHKKNLLAIPAEDIFGSVSLSVVWMNDTLIDEKLLKFTVDTAKKMALKILSGEKPDTTDDKK